MAALDGKDFTEVNKIVKNIKKTIENKYESQRKLKSMAGRNG